MNKKYTSSLTAEEKNIVETYVSLVEIVVKRHISINKTINGLSYDDLIQEGNIGLCTAAKTFNGCI